MPLHAYQAELRVRAALELVIDTEQDLLTIALSFGFCSHAHSTACFRRAFGVTPSSIRRFPADTGTAGRGSATRLAVPAFTI